MPDAGFTSDSPRWQWWHERPRVDAALSVSPAPTLTEPGRGNVYPGSANQYPEQPGSVSAVSPAPQEQQQR